MPVRARRSALYLPASNARAIEKARELPCDVVILDLEDAVAPDAKLLARAQAAAAVRAGGFGARELVVRINGRDTEWGRDDLQSLVGLRPDAVLLPKVDSAADIAEYEALLGADSEIAVWAMIETARSVMALNEVAAASATTRLSCLVLGTNDLAKELGAEPDTLRTPFLGLLGLSVAAARAHGLTILDGVCNELEDEAAFEAQCRQARAFGFDGKTLIHPRQIDPCNTVFTPDAAAVAWAERVVSAFQHPTNVGKGALRIDGRMVERLHLEQAQRTLARAAMRDSPAG